MCACVANQKYQVVHNGRCQPGFEIRSISECSAAAKALNALDFSVSSDGNYGSNSFPPFCYYNNGKMKFNAGNNKGYCSSVICLCVAAPTTSTTTTTTTTTLSSHSGGSGSGTRYVLRTSGRCPSGAEIRSKSGCSAAATYLNLGDQWASYDYQNTRASYDPPFCYYEGGSLKFNDYGSNSNTGYCSSYDTCLCKVPQTTTTTTTGTFA